MTGVGDPDRRATSSSSGRAASRGPGSWARWWSGWRIALRMARRDVRRYRGRSALVLVMVGLPIALIVGGLTLVATTQLSAPERLPWSLGSAQAHLSGPSDVVLEQEPGDDPAVGWAVSGESAPAAPIPGFAEGAPLAERATAVSDLVDRPVVTVAGAEVRWRAGERTPYLRALFVDPAQELGAKLDLLSGRMPTDSGEVMVTPAGRDAGLPGAGEVVIVDGAAEYPVEVVGTARAYDQLAQMPDVVTTQPWETTTPYEVGWLVVGEAPLDWSMVRELNAYGFAVESAAVLRDPPEVNATRDQGSVAVSAQDFRSAALVAGAVLFVVTALLVAPAFAVGAARQRRSLALAACSGAETRQLRRLMLAQAVVLGVGGVLTGAALGMAAVAGWLPVWQGMRPERIQGVLELPWLPVLIVCGCGILAALTAALIPTARLGRLDIVGVMRGQHVPRPVSRVAPVLGVLAFGAGAATLTYAGISGQEVSGLLGVLGLFVGALLLVPVLLVGIGHLGGGLPLAWRMAARDAARQRGRTVPTVAAVLAGAALLTTYAVVIESDTADLRRTYVPQMVMGEGELWIGPEDVPAIHDVIERVAPQWQTVVQHRVGADTPPGDPEPEAQPFVHAMLQGCAVEQTFRNPMDPAMESESDPCLSYANEASIPRADIEIWPAEEIVRRLQLEGRTAAEVRDGRAIAVEGTPGAPTGEQLSMVTGTSVTDWATGENTDIQPVSRGPLDVTVVDGAVHRDGRVPSQTGLLVPESTARQMGWPLRVNGLAVHDPGGALDPELQAEVAESLWRPEMFYVERGPQRSDALPLAAVTGIAVTLLVTVTLISTALALAEQQRDLGTLAAVGATRGTRRRLAAVQAAAVALVGCVLGVAVGAVSGAALARVLTQSGFDEVSGVPLALDPVVALPWPQLLTTVVGVPLVAAVVAAVSIRQSPRLTRRAV